MCNRSYRATHEPTGITSETVTRESGGYVFPSLSVGHYTVVVELQGFAKVTRTKNVLTVGAELRIDAVLHPRGLSEAVTVTETTQQVRAAEWLARHKGPVVLANQATPRMISCTGDRTPAREVLATRFR